MNIDVHAHYIPPGSLKAASDVARSHGLKLEKDERNRDMLTRDDRPLLTQPKGEFSDLDLRLSIMDHQGVDMQALAPAGSFFLDACRQRARICPLAQRSIRRSRRKTSSALRGPGVGTDARRCAGRRRIRTCDSQARLRGAEIASNINGRYLDDPASNLSGRRRKRWMR
jgi:hypothetical protein